MLNKNWSGTMIRTDDPVREEDLHKSNTRKWLFRFLFDGQAFCKDLSMCVQGKTSHLKIPFKKSFHWRGKRA